MSTTRPPFKSSYYAYFIKQTENHFHITKEIPEKVLTKIAKLYISICRLGNFLRGANSLPVQVNDIKQVFAQLQGDPSIKTIYTNITDKAAEPLKQAGNLTLLRDSLLTVFETLKKNAFSTIQQYLDSPETIAAPDTALTQLEKELSAFQKGQVKPFLEKYENTKTNLYQIHENAFNTLPGLVKKPTIPITAPTLTL